MLYQVDDLNSEPKCNAVVRTMFNEGFFEYDRKDTTYPTLGELVNFRSGTEALKLMELFSRGMISQEHQFTFTYSR